MDQEKMPADGQAVSAEKKLSEVKPKLTPSFRIFEEAVIVWWRNLKKFIMMYVWGLVFSLIPLAVIVALLCLNLIPSLQVWLGLHPTLVFRIASLVVIVIAMLYVAYNMIRSGIGMYLLIKNDYLGRERDIFKTADNWIWPYLGLTILTTIFIFLWTCLLIIPGIIFSIFYSFAVYALFFEEKKGMAAIKRSVQLVKHYWWAVLGRFCLLGLIIWAFTLILSIPAVFIPESSAMLSVWNVIMQVISMLIGPIALLFSYQIYQDLVKIKK